MSVETCKHPVHKQHINTVKPAYVVTSVKGSPVLNSHFYWSLEAKYSVNEPVLRGHLS